MPVRPTFVTLLLMLGLAGGARGQAATRPTTVPDDMGVWPNAASRANSDPWLAANHDRIRVMRPRVLLVNFSNEHDAEHIQRLTDRIILGIREGSRWHGYRDPQAPAFLEYSVFKFVDLRDADRKVGDARLMPGKPPEAETGTVRFRYAALYDDEFAARYGVADPDRPGRFLNLGELVDRGLVHEVWVVVSGNTRASGPAMWEAIELKPVYGDDFARQGDRRAHCGNGHDPDQPWIGRSLRIGCINASRGPGCFLESLSHSFERMCLSGTVPYLRPLFAEFAGFDLRQRYGAPFGSLYSAQRDEAKIEYPNPTTALVPHRGRVVRIENYVPAAGNVHFLPNGRADYDLDNAAPVLSTIEDWRMGSGPDGKDLARPWTPEVLKPYRRQFTDCMGPWLVYWRQNVPGLDNKARDDAGRPMKNWWPFLFY